ncbi:MAG TPA: DEAD/DEAH box helicase [Acidimicrobiales bacterium]|nr:DEAD/DEAH box helicase [Acidimicrobiales bacterium]
MVLDNFSPPVREWFRTTFGAPTPAQAEGWPAIAAGEHALILAPTGSGKTLAAFLWSIDRFMSAPAPTQPGTRVLYLSPLRALAVDVDKNLRAPLAGIALAAERLDTSVYVPTVGLRTGDTPSRDRRALLRHPPDILITTPESLYLMLTSSARETLRTVDYVIVDEIHALAATKRGAHLSLTLERLDSLRAETPGTVAPQRIGLSATQRPLDEIARFLGGYQSLEGGPADALRPVTIVDAGVRKPLDVEVIVPVEDMSALGEFIDEPPSGPVSGGQARRSIWPAVHPRILDLVMAHRSTIIFVNARRLAERLATRLNELAAERAGLALDDGSAAPEVVKAHHGSLSRERRLLIEDELKTGRLRGLVATSSLELGIDMGAVDLVIQVESPGAVSRGLQRVGRAGHQVGQPSVGKVFPKHRGDLVEAAVVVDRMRRGAIEATRYPRNPLDVLAQQIVAMCAMQDWPVGELLAMVRRSANFHDLSDDLFASVLDMLSGRYPSEEFGELRPRIVWDRVTDTVRARAGAQRLAVTSGGTIPDRGLFPVVLPDGVRVGELDEEMVYESRPGETFLLGATTWQIDEITFDRVVVHPAPGQPGRMPFWRGDGPGRPLELGRAVGEFVRTIRSADAVARLHDDFGLDEWAARNLVQYLDDQADATGSLPDDRTIVVERFRDEIGDWRVCILSPFGARVHAPWGLALQARLGERWDVDVELLWSDDGIVIRLPAAIDEVPLADLQFDPDEIEDVLLERLPNSAMFASRFRECAARALLLPRRRPDKRTPLWQQRQRSADLLAVAANYPQFPILLEATRECVNDVFDLPALKQLLGDLQARRVRMVAVDTPRASPFAQSLLFGWIAVYMYEGDAPLAERRAAALALDRDLLRDLLGADELRELLDPAVLADLELELQRLSDGRRARNGDEVHDVLRALGPLNRLELDARCEVDAAPLIAALIDERRVIEVVIATETRLAAAEDASRVRDALGAALPRGLPGVFTDPVDDPLGDLVTRFARTHGPFVTADVARRYGVPVDRVRPALERLSAAGRVVRGEFRPDGTQREWCDSDVLRQLRRRSLAALRREIEPVDPEALVRFLPQWQGVGVPRRGLDGLVEVIGILQGAAIPASVFENDVLRVRLLGYRPADLDALCTAGEVVWIGSGSIGGSDGRVRVYFRDQVASLAPSAGEAVHDSALHEALLAHLRVRGASFWADLVRAASDAGQPYDDSTVLAALWDLVWAGLVTNDSFASLRAFVSGRSTRAAPRGRPRPGRLARLGPPAGAGRWSLVDSLIDPRPDATIAAHAHALQMAERYGVLTREAALGEGSEGGFAGLYPMLKLLEERGTMRRGYFVAGLGAAQFALPGAVDRLRSPRDADPPPLVLAATDPANPFGASLPWPESGGRPARAAGAFVVLDHGHLVAYLERGGRSILTFPATGDNGRWAEALTTLVKDGRLRSLEIARIDAVPARESAHHPALLAAGFVGGYRGLIYRGH